MKPVGFIVGSDPGQNDQASSALQHAGGRRGFTLQHRLGTAAGEALITGGYIVGANGGGAWSLPIIGAGMLLNTVSDYRYSAQHGV